MIDEVNFIEPGLILLNEIDRISPLVWRKFRARYSNFWKDGNFEIVDQTSFPPYVSFRFATENIELLDKLVSVISEYDGYTKWSMVGFRRNVLPGRNWVISPEIVAKKREELGDLKSVDSYFLSEFPDFSSPAYSDLNKLSGYIKYNFSDVV